MDNVINVEEAMALIEMRRRINSIDINTAVFVKGGKVLYVSDKSRRHWQFTGLNTIDFVDMVAGQENGIETFDRHAESLEAA